MSTNDVGPPQAPVPVPGTAPAPAPVTAPTIAPATGANPMPFPQGQFPIFVNIPPPLTEITDAAPSPSDPSSVPVVPSTPPATTALGTNATTNATVPIIDYRLFVTDCHYGCSAAYSFSAVVAVIIMSAVAFVILHVTRKRREYAEEQIQQEASIAESDPSVVKYQPPLAQRYDGVSKPNEFKRRSDFGTPQDWNEYDLRKPNPYANQPPPVPYGVAGVAPGGMGYLYGEQGRTSEDTTHMTDEEYMNMETPDYGGVGGFASMLPPPPPAPTQLPPGDSPTSPNFQHHHQRDSDYSVPFAHMADQQQLEQQLHHDHDDQHLHALHPDHPGDSPISATGAAHFAVSSIGPPRPAPPPPSQPPDILAPRAQYNPISFPQPPSGSPPPPVMAQEMQPQQPHFMEVVPNEYEGYLVEGEEYEFHPQQYEEDEHHHWYADDGSSVAGGGGGEDLDVGQYYAPHPQPFDHTKQP